MEKYHVGEIVRYLRKENKMTQEELADGICSPVTISRIESGTQMPSDRIINQILERLGSDVYQTANIVRVGNHTTIDKNIYSIGRMIEEGKFDIASKQLMQIKEEKLDNRSKQYLVLLRASIILQTGDGNLAEIIEQIRQAIELTKRDFNFSCFKKVPLTVREANLLNVLCVAYYRNERLEEALSLAKELREALIFRKENFKNNQELLINVLINLSQMLEGKEHFKEALKICEEAIEISMDSKYQIMFSELHFFKAKLLYKNGHQEESLQLFKVIYPYIKLQKKAAFISLIESYVWDNFQIKL